MSNSLLEGIADDYKDWDEDEEPLTMMAATEFKGTCKTLIKVIDQYLQMKIGWSDFLSRSGAVMETLQGRYNEMKNDDF